MHIQINRKLKLKFCWEECSESSLNGVFQRLSTLYLYATTMIGLENVVLMDIAHSKRTMKVRYFRMFFVSCTKK